MLAYEITGVQDSQIDAPGGQDVVNTYDVTYTVPSISYASEVQVPKGADDVVGAIKAAVEKAVNEVEAIFALSTTTTPAA